MHLYIRHMQKHVFHVENSFEPSGNQREIKVENSGREILNIQYGEKYPNSYLDIYLCNEEKNPLIFYVHGGGFTWGDKRDGDPNAKGAKQGQFWYFKRFLNAGYHVVSVNYALAPEYKYPTPIIQLKQALEFLNKNGDQFNFDTKRFIFAGSSAGGQLIGQLANIETNPNYAFKLGVKATLGKDSVKACLFNSALLDCERFDVTHQLKFDFMLRRCGRAYFGCRKMRGNIKTKEASIMEQYNENAKAGSAKAEAIKAREDALEESYSQYMAS